jgi:hypothetical protein
MVGTIFLTHNHPDHALGLVDALANDFLTVDFGVPGTPQEFNIYGPPETPALVNAAYDYIRIPYGVFAAEPLGASTLINPFKAHVADEGRGRVGFKSAGEGADLVSLCWRRRWGAIRGRREAILLQTGFRGRGPGPVLLGRRQHNAREHVGDFETLQLMQPAVGYSPAERLLSRTGDYAHNQPGN